MPQASAAQRQRSYHDLIRWDPSLPRSWPPVITTPRPGDASPPEQPITAGGPGALQPECRTESATPNHTQRPVADAVRSQPEPAAAAAPAAQSSTGATRANITSSVRTAPIGHASSAHPARAPASAPQLGTRPGTLASLVPQISKRSGSLRSAALGGRRPGLTRAVPHHMGQAAQPHISQQAAAGGSGPASQAGAWVGAPPDLPPHLLSSAAAGGGQAGHSAAAAALQAPKPERGGGRGRHWW